VITAVCNYALVKADGFLLNENGNMRGYDSSIFFGNYVLYTDRKKENLIIFEKNEYVMFIEGFFWDDKDVIGKMVNDIDMDNVKHLSARLKEINGYYSGILMAKGYNQYVFFSDKFGIRRIYYDCHLQAFSNNMFLLLSLCGYRIDDIAIREKVVLDYAINDRTYFTNIKCLQPLRIGVLKNGVFREVFYRINVIRDGSIDAVKEAYRRVFEKLSMTNIDFGLGLSRGKDSRMYLYFLNVLGIDCKLITFRLNEVDHEYRDCVKIARCLGRNLLIVPTHRPSEEEIISSAKDAILSHEFYRLGKFAKENGVEGLLIGYLGDQISGKLSVFRNFGVREFDKLVRHVFLEYSERLSRRDIESLSGKLNGAYELVYENWNKTFEQFQYLNLPEAEILHYLEVRGYRRILPRLLQIIDYVDIILPNTANEVFYSYLRLPLRLITSQQAHTYLAGMDKSARAAKSTGVPVSLRKERYFRTLIRLAVKVMNLAPEWKTPPRSEALGLRSEALRDFFGERELRGNAIVRKRLHELDVYFRFIEERFSRLG
jgi:hypothetical protein